MALLNASNANAAQSLCGASSKIDTYAQLGSARRTFLFFDVYDVALYIPRQDVARLSASTNRATHILNSRQSKQLYLKYARDIGVKKVREVLRDGFQNNASAEQWMRQQDRFERFTAKISSDISEGDQLVLAWSEACGLQVQLNGALVLEDGDPEFTRILLSIWLGDQAVVEREALLGLP
ncbi:MAG: chalcone isomerase family protein [Oleiphilaceae bacterium]|nr:chalcone isomerase family protein [Oleiphilaceae bacterium]